MERDVAGDWEEDLYRSKEEIESYVRDEYGDLNGEALVYLQKKTSHDEDIEEVLDNHGSVTRDLIEEKLEEYSSTAAFKQWRSDRDGRPEAESRG